MRSLLFTPLILAAAALWGGAALAQRSEISPAELTELRDMRGQLDGKVREMNAAKKSIDVKQGELNNTRQSIAQLQADNDRARAKLKQLRDVEDTNPDAIQPATMAAAVKDNRESFARLSAAKSRIGRLEAEVLDLRGAMNRQSADIEQLRGSYENALNAATERLVEARIRAMQVKKPADVTYVQACGDNMGPVDCERLSQKNAEAKASEQGSVVIVESLTEVKNFQLSKEELRSRVSAQLSDVRVTNKIRFDPQTGQLSVETHIVASVIPAISPSFREQLRSGAHSEVVALAGGPLDFSAIGAVAAVPRSVSDDAAAGRDEQQRRLEEEQRRQAQQRKLDEEKRQLEAERAQLAERRRREEAERAEQERRDREAAEDASRRRRGTYTPTF